MHFGKQPPATLKQASSVATASPRPSPVATIRPALIHSAAPTTPGLETNPALAEQYAEKAVGNCLESEDVRDCASAGGPAPTLGPLL